MKTADLAAAAATICSARLAPIVWLAMLAQPVAFARAGDDWSRVEQLPLHTGVVVRIGDGRTWEGSIKTVKPDSLTLMIHEPGRYVIDRDLPRSEIKRIRREGPGKLAEILVGTAVGTGVGVGSGRSWTVGEDPGLTTMVGGILGALFGSLFGRFIVLPGRTIYEVH